jgi:hypothetical protein
MQSSCWDAAHGRLPREMRNPGWNPHLAVTPFPVCAANTARELATLGVDTEIAMSSCRLHLFAMSRSVITRAPPTLAVRCGTGRSISRRPPAGTSPQAPCACRTTPTTAGCLMLYTGPRSVRPTRPGRPGAHSSQVQQGDTQQLLARVSVS